MEPSARDRRIRIGAGLIMAALALLSLTLIPASVGDRRVDVLLVIIICVQSLGTFALAWLLVSGKAGTEEFVLVRGRWRKVLLLVVFLVGVAQFVLQMIDEPGYMAGTAMWLNGLAICIPLLFGPGRPRFQDEEQWISSMSHQGTMDALGRAFDQPGLSTKTEGSDVWVEISREWQGEWRHREAAKHMKVRPRIHFIVEETDDGARVTAFSREILIGMYDVSKLAEEMSESGVTLAREATSS